MAKYHFYLIDDVNTSIISFWIEVLTNNKARRFLNSENVELQNVCLSR